MFHLHRVPAHVALVLGRNLFIVAFPLEPELGFVIRLAGAMIDAVEIEFPHAAKKCSFDGNAIANLPAKTLGCSCAGDCALTVFHIVLPLLFRDIELRINSAPVIDVHCELGKEIPFVLIDTAKPIGICEFLHAGNSPDLIRIRQRQGLDNGRAIDDHQTVGASNINAAAEREAYHCEHSKQKQCDGKRSNREDEAYLLAKQVGANQSQKFHRAPPLETVCRRSASTSTPFSRCNVVFARAATTGSCVTIKTVFLYSFTRRRISSIISSALLRSRSPVGSSHSRKVGSETMARAIVTRCSCPPESWRGKWCKRSLSPTTPSAVSTCFFRCALESLVKSSGSSTF